MHFFLFLLFFFLWNGKRRRRDEDRARMSRRREGDPTPAVGTSEGFGSRGRATFLYTAGWRAVVVCWGEGQETGASCRTRTEALEVVVGI